AAPSPRRGRFGRRARAGSVSACSGLSAGAFAPLGNGAAATAVHFEPATAAARSGSVAGSREPGRLGSVSAGAGSTARPGTARPGTAAGGAGAPGAGAGPAAADTHGCGTSAGSTSADSAGCGTTGGSAFADTGGRSSEAMAGVRVTDPVQAVALLSAALDFLAHGDAAQWPEGGAG